MEKKPTKNKKTKPPTDPEKASPKKQSNEKSADEKKDFLVVGLGASAGGVKALQEFFASMPADSGMAFVVILHLSPQHESALPQILQAQTRMRVIQVNETHKVAPDHVYVISPNSQLEMVDGVIRAAAPEKKLGTRVAIDTFFRTLAQAYQRNAVCVVLSGTGTDGTLGLKRVKESNGFAIVQQPEDADYDQMPRSAMATGLADWILPVRQMADKLINFKESSERLHLTNSADAEEVGREINADESLREILTILRVRTGHDFTNYKKPTLIRRIARHLQIHELEDIPTYLNLLRENPDEIQFLQRNLLINVTNFFRDREAFKTLEMDIVPKLFSGKMARDTVRVWTAGCASGEEAYSVAMLLQEHADKLTDPPKFQIFATDVDDEAVQQAREHLYPENIEADVSPERLKRFFTRDGGEYRVRKELRETVLFAPHNILRDPPFSRLDLVTCRNLLIYLNRDAQERVMEIFHFALAANGYLFLGASESAESTPELFEAVNKKQRVYQRRVAPQTYYSPPRLPIAGNWQLNLPDAKKVADRTRTVSLGEVHYKLLESFAPPSILVNRDFNVVYMSESVGRFLQFAGGEPSNDLLKLVKPDLLSDLRAALFTAQRDRQSSESFRVGVNIDGAETFVDLSVRVVDEDVYGGDFLLVIFDESDDTKDLSEKQARRKKAQRESGKQDAMTTVVERLEEELQRAKTNLRATIEQHEISVEELKASNEELQAINEELRSASEELETSKEELQSVNEELTTVNHELKDKIDEATKANSDLQNLIISTDIATIFLDRNLKIKRYAPLIEQLFNIKPTDIGRPLEHFTNSLEYDGLTRDAEEVLRTLRTVEREIDDKNGRHFLTRFSPYRTVDDRIEGVVLNFLDVTQKRLAEQAVRESEQSFRVFTEATSEIVFKMNPDWTEMRSLVGKEFLPTSDAPRPDWMDAYIPEADKAAMRAAIKQAVKTKRDFELEHRVVRLDGSIGWTFSRAVPVLDERGAILEWFGTAQDITVRRTIEERLRDSEKRLRIAVEAAAMGTWDWDLLADEVHWNEQHFVLFGMPPTNEPLPSAAFYNHVHPDDRERVGKLLEQAIKIGKPFEAEFRIVRDDRTTRWMEGYGQIVEMRDGKPVRMSGVMSDITNRKRVEQAVVKSEERLNLILKSITDYAVITSDPNGIINGWNTGAVNTFGWTEKEAVGQSCAIIFTPADRAAGAPEKEMETARRDGIAEDRRWHVRKNGSRFFASGTVSPIRDGEFEGFVKITSDQTERMEAERVAQEKETLRRIVTSQEDERRRIARDIHDHFGQQLVALKLKLDHAKKSCEEERICDEIEEAKQIVRRLDADVDFIAWELRPVALEDLGLLAALKDFVRDWSHHTKIEIEFHTTGLNKTKLVFETETNLYRIVQEALNNIYKHAQATKVSVLLERRQNQITLIVEDGGGFDTESGKTRRKGIGLSGMAERARILGGDFHLESKKGKGTTVFVRVPFKTEENQ